MPSRTRTVSKRPVRTLAIAIPSRNRPNDIKKCVASIAAQPTPPNQLIVMDQSIDKYELPNLPYLEHIHDTNVRGLPAARNCCIRALRCDAVLFLDDDCELLSDCVPAVMNSFNRRPDAIGLQCAIRFPQTTSWKARMLRAIFSRGFFREGSIKRRNGIELRTLGGCAMAFRVGLFEHELFDEHLNDYANGEDWEFSKRSQSYGTMWKVQEARVHHHTATVNRYNADRMFHQRWTNFLYFYNKYNAGSDLRNRFWLRWWLLGESIFALRKGIKPPIFWASRSVNRVKT